MRLQRCSHFLFGGLRQTETLVAHIVDVAVLTNKAIAQDPFGSQEAGERLESDEATRIFLTEDIDVVLVRDRVVFAVDGEDDIGQTLGGGTIDDVDAFLLVQLATELLGDLLDLSAGTGDQRGASVRDGLRALGIGCFDNELIAFAGAVTNTNTVQKKFVISGMAQRNPVDLGRAVLRIVIAQRDLTTGRIVGVGLGHPDGEQRLRQQFLVDHGLDWRFHLIDGQRLEGQAQNTVHRLIGEEGSQFGGNTESVVHAQVAQANFVFTDVSRARASSVFNGERLAIIFEGAGLRGVELVLASARVLDVGSRSIAIVAGLATEGGHPQVGTASVHNDGELLGRCTDGDVRHIDDIVEVQSGDVIIVRCTASVPHRLPHIPVLLESALSGHSLA